MTNNDPAAAGPATTVTDPAMDDGRATVVGQALRPSGRAS